MTRRAGAANRANPESTARAGLSGLDGSLTTAKPSSVQQMTSVNVPPVSTPTTAIAPPFSLFARDGSYLVDENAMLPAQLSAGQGGAPTKKIARRSRAAGPSRAGRNHYCGFPIFFKGQRRRVFVT